MLQRLKGTTDYQWEPYRREASTKKRRSSEVELSDDGATNLANLSNPLVRRFNLPNLH
jgi:hypothetical protein